MASEKLLDTSRLETLDLASPLVPPGFVRRHEAWHYEPANRERYGLVAAGVVLCAIGAVFLIVPGKHFLKEFLYTAFHSREWWINLVFAAPFAFVGVAQVVCGLALIGMQTAFRVGALGVREHWRVFGKTLRDEHVLSKEILALRVLKRTQGAGEAHITFVLTLLTKQDTLILPISVTKTQADRDPRLLRRYARWVCHVIHRDDLPFDATPYDGALPQTVASAARRKIFAKKFGRFALSFMVLWATGLAALFVSGVIDRTTDDAHARKAEALVAARQSDRDGAKHESSARDRNKAIDTINAKNALLSRIGTASTFAPVTDIRDYSECNAAQIPFCGTLAWAVTEKRHDLVKIALAESANPIALAVENVYQGWSAWAYALARGDAKMIGLFLDAGLSVNEKHDLPFDQQRQLVLPLLFAIQSNHPEAIKFLIARGANPHALGPWNYPVANFAAYYGYVESLRALREAGVDLLARIPSGQPHDGETFLMHAAQGGKKPAVEYLQSLGARAGDVDPRRKTASDHARAYGHIALSISLQAQTWVD